MDSRRSIHVKKEEKVQVESIPDCQVKQLAKVPVLIRIVNSLNKNTNS